MISNLTIAQRAAFDQLLQRNGEDVTLNGVSIRALINRDTESQEIPGNVEISTLEGSIIQTPSSVSAAIGDVFIDSFAISHRVKRVLNLAHANQFKCEVTR